MPQRQHPDERLKEERHRDRGGAGQTVTAQGENQAPKAQTPNERDESAHDQAPAASSIRRMGELASHDVESGQPDTDRGPVLDATYEKVKEGEPKKRRE